MAKADMQYYCDSGFLPYHYGTVSMIPIYAAAGFEVASGHYTQNGQVILPTRPVLCHLRKLHLLYTISSWVAFRDGMAGMRMAAGNNC